VDNTNPPAEGGGDDRFWGVTYSTNLLCPDSHLSEGTRGRPSRPPMLGRGRKIVGRALGSNIRAALPEHFVYQPKFSPAVSKLLHCGAEEVMSDKCSGKVRCVYIVHL